MRFSPPPAVAPPDGADRREHRDRRRLDGRLPGGARALPELARRAAVRPLRRRELPRLRRALAAGVLRTAAHRDGDTIDLPADAGLLPRRLRAAERVRADPVRAHR